MHDDDELTSARFDVACVGCGPAGNLASCLLARQGLRVLLIDKASSLPRSKVCGGGLTLKALELLPCDVASLVHHRMVGAYVGFAGRPPMHVASEGIGAMVERSEFDAFMTEHAVAAGVTLMPRSAVEGLWEEDGCMAVQTSRGTFRARLVIGADGARSRVRALWFPGRPPDDHAFGIEANYFWLPGTVPPEAALRNALFDFGAVRNGYGWIFPKRDHFNVGLYRVAKAPGGDPGLKQALSDFVRRHPVLAACRSSGAIGHPIALSGGRQPVGRGRVILIGDAAGLGEAFFGEGIAFALKSGAIAAAWAGRALKNGGTPDGARFRDEALRPLMVELRYSRWMARALYAVPPPLMDRLVAFAAIRRTMLRLLEGRASYRSSFWKLLALIPLALLRRRSATTGSSPFMQDAG